MSAPPEHRTELDEKAFFADCSRVSDCAGQPYGRLHAYWAAEAEHKETMQNKNSGVSGARPIDGD
jgi:hypothetical protein